MQHGAFSLPDNRLATTAARDPLCRPKFELSARLPNEPTGDIRSAAAEPARHNSRPVILVATTSTPTVGTHLLIACAHLLDLFNRAQEA